MERNKYLGYLVMAASQFVRLASGMVVFVLLARLLGPEGFGSFALWLAVATLVAVITNFGFTTFCLREIGANPGSVSVLLSDVFSAKLLLSGVVLGIGCSSLLILDHPLATLFLVLLAAQVADSFTEFFNVFFRVEGRHSSEASNALHGATVHLLAFLSLFMFESVTVLGCALMFLSTRIYVLLNTMRSGIAVLGWHSPSTIGGALRRLRACSSYAFEIFLNTVYTQLDALVVSKIAGISGLGIYQAGMKLVQGASRAAPIIAQVVLPDVSRAHAAGQGFRRAALKMVLLFSGIGLVAGSILGVFRDFWVSLLFGAEYLALSTLLPLFGLVLWCRFTETGAGLVLVSMGLQHQKVKLVGMQLALLVLVGGFLGSYFGVTGWLWGVVVSTLGALGSYRWLYLKALSR